VTSQSGRRQSQAAKAQFRLTWAIREANVVPLRHSDTPRQGVYTSTRRSTSNNDSLLLLTTRFSLRRTLFVSSEKSPTVITTTHTRLSFINQQSCSLLLPFLLFSWPLSRPSSLRALDPAHALTFTSSSLADGTRTVSERIFRSIVQVHRLTLDSSPRPPRCPHLQRLRQAAWQEL
jgi:hypothetical protein